MRVELVTDFQKNVVGNARHQKHPQADTGRVNQVDHNHEYAEGNKPAPVFLRNIDVDGVLQEQRVHSGNRDGNGENHENDGNLAFIIFLSRRRGGGWSRFLRPLSALHLLYWN